MRPLQLGVFDFGEVVAEVAERQRDDLPTGSDFRRRQALRADLPGVVCESGRTLTIRNTAAGSFRTEPWQRCHGTAIAILYALGDPAIAGGARLGQGLGFRSDVQRSGRPKTLARVLTDAPQSLVFCSRRPLLALDVERAVVDA